ncbi:hypothetical protein [Fimbriiglobus ruber]|uniref:BBC1/AIM3 cysteine proteinase-fold domain-containing protein n=1 Tax=Fimbriiglobus ruber TaxID=1908690 RepID=A0A225DRG6_9BACT|nr:hypothetical protein [Fimbriiglobus ruber]OWK42224.1 hypothetical protein FRUB_04302 [Fimbriiglobus ruber]
MKSLMTALSATFLFSSLATAADHQLDPNSLGGKVVAYATQHEGQRIGGGQCTDLVNAALASAGARQIRIETTAPSLVKAGFPSQMYRWGVPVPLVTAEAKHVLPGMILQFEDCTFKKPDGTQTWVMPHHTAIIKSAHGTMVTVIQQNAPTGGPVSEATFDLRWLQKKTADGKAAVLSAYIPQAK